MLAPVTLARTEQRAKQMGIKLINVNVPKGSLDQGVEKFLVKNKLIKFLVRRPLTKKYKLLSMNERIYCNLLSFLQRMLAPVTLARTEQRAQQLEIKFINVNVPKDSLDQGVEKVKNKLIKFLER